MSSFNFSRSQRRPPARHLPSLHRLLVIGHAHLKMGSVNFIGHAHLKMLLLLMDWQYIHFYVMWLAVLRSSRARRLIVYLMWLQLKMLLLYMYLPPTSRVLQIWPGTCSQTGEAQLLKMSSRVLHRSPRVI